ncbi:hypothetical protein AA313_de0201878 [Arthrobotrys entomopaga]|nr:hypothetical protein AA313_de0201878 [Arthrobotrys entomopaga]
MFSKAASLLLTLITLVSIVTALPFKNVADLDKRDVCWDRTLALILHSRNINSKFYCASWLGTSGTTGGATKTVYAATVTPTATVTKTVTSVMTITTTEALDAVTSVKSGVTTVTTHVTATETILLFKPRQMIKKDNIIARATAKPANTVDSFGLPRSQISSWCSCILPSSLLTPVATTTVTDTTTAPTVTGTVTEDEVSTVTATVTKNGGVVVVTSMSTVVKTDATTLTINQWFTTIAS